MPKDYTDYVVFILDAGDRVYHKYHFRNTKGGGLDHSLHPHNGHDYLLELDRAYRVKWAPWEKVIWAEPKTIEHQEPWYFKGENRLWAKKTVTVQEVKNPLIKLRVLATINEFLRSKKIGMLIYREPPPPKTVTVLVDCVCSCGFKGKNIAGTKVHSSSKGPDHELKMIYKTQEVGRVTKPIEPHHISKIHQPSGELRE